MNKGIIIIIISCIFIISTTVIADEWDDEWEFEYENENFGPQSDFSNYDILSFGGKGNFTAQAEQFTAYDTLSFGGKLNVSTDTIEIELQPADWDGGTPDCGTMILYNFTFWQNGTDTIDVKIGINNTNYTFVNYTTWLTNSYNRYCANFTNDSWATEYMIEPKSGGLLVTYLNTSVPGSSSFPVGIRIRVPETVRLANVREDFTIYIEATAS